MILAAFDIAVLPVSPQSLLLATGLANGSVNFEQILPSNILPTVMLTRGGKVLIEFSCSINEYQSRPLKPWVCFAVAATPSTGAVIGLRLTHWYRFSDYSTFLDYLSSL